MLEGLITWVLNTYIGEYVENLNTDQLTVAIFQGQVELENLPLKKTALKSLDLPIEVKSGFIGRIQLRIPLRRLHSEQWVITLDKLYLVAGPTKKEEYDPESEQKREQERKQKQLQELEDNFKFQKEAIHQKDVENKSTSWWSYGSAIASNIVENLQLRVNDIHMRYEDDVTIPGHTFACGVTIKSVSAQSCNGNWEPGFVSRSGSDLMFKLVSLDSFSIYWDSDVDMVGSFTGSQLEESLQAPCDNSDSDLDTKCHKYILQPVSVQARMQRNKSAQPLRSPNSPRLLTDIQLDKFPLALRETQICGLVALVRELDRHDRGRRHRRFRPSCPVAGNCRLWWNFALDATLHTIRDWHKRRSRSFVCRRARDNVQYTKAFLEYLTVGPKYMSKASKDFMDQFEFELTFDELKLLRKLVTDDLLEKEKQASSVSTTTNEVVATSPGQLSSPSTPQPGILQTWFPGWTGWYGYGSSESVSSAETLLDAKESDVDNDGAAVTGHLVDPSGVLPSAVQTTEFDQEILDALSDSAESNTLLKQDMILLQLNFCLQTGKLQLLTDGSKESDTSSCGADAESKDERCLFELEYSEVKMGFQSRPRTNGMKFSVSVSDFLLQDKMTPNSIRPTLIAPLQRQGSGLLVSSASSSSPFATLVSKSAEPQNSEGFDRRLFELIYEKKPFRTKADYKLSIHTKPLDIIYNPAAIERIMDFFTVKKPDAEAIKTELEITAKNQYESLKKQTQEELRQTVDALLEGDSRTRSKRWILDLDISAPHITIPESFQNSETMLVVFDLGHLQLCNAVAEAKATSILPSEDDDEFFVTPLSTPTNEKEPEPEKEMDEKAEANSENLSDASLRSRIYDRYFLSLSDLQVMVGRAKDQNWKTSYFKRTSLLHVVDKFSISLQFERRLLYVVVPDWPKVMILGKIPQLVMHINEEKIMALKTCIDALQHALSGAGSSSVSTTVKESVSSDKPEKSSLPKPSQQSKNSKVTDSMLETDHCMLFVMDFEIEQMSLEIRSRECHSQKRLKSAECKSLVELQVNQVRTVLTKKLFDTSVKFSVHSLLVVDALQTLGPDYELLVASHKNLCIDRQSGRIFDSQPTSPISPSSPTSPQSPAEPAVVAEVQPVLHSHVQSVTSKLQGLVDQPNNNELVNLNSSREFQLPLINFHTTPETLITIEVDIMQPRNLPNASLDEALCLANIDFNSLDVIANQHTIVELMAFFRAVFPTKPPHPSSVEKTNVGESECEQAMSSNYEGSNDIRKEVTANFHRLNVLLMRVDEKEGLKKTAHKVATVTLVEAKIQASLANHLSIDGSLCGLQLLDLTPEGNRNQKVLHVGCDPPQMESFPSDLLTGKAFNFTLSRPGTSMANSAECSNTSDAASGGKMRLVVRVASVYYLHAPNLLLEVSQCITEFKDYLMLIRTSLATAAKELALGLVHKHSDPLDPAAHGSSWSLDGKLNRNKEHTRSTDDLTFDGVHYSSENENICDAEVEEKSEQHMDLLLDAVLQSPIILLPQFPNSKDVLVLSLGKIIVSNCSSFGTAEKPVSDSVSVEVRDMSMFSLSLGQLDISSCMKSESITQILHHTTLELSIQKQKRHVLNSDSEIMDFIKASSDQNFNSPKQLFEVSGHISPLKLVLTKQVFEQILKTLDNLVPDDDFASGNEPGAVASDFQRCVDSEGDIMNLETSSVSFGSARSLGDDSLLILRGCFKLPMLNAVLMSEHAEKIQGLVDLRLENFCVNLLNIRWFKTLDMRLESLVLEDLLHQGDSAGPQYMMVSHSTARRNPAAPVLSRMLSVSCPSSFEDFSPPMMPMSLPSSLCLPQPNLLFRRVQRTSSKEEKQTKVSKFNASSSSADEPELFESSGPLVHIKVNLVDKKCPDFNSKYNKVNRIIAVDFNCLETRINLETWVLVLEFLGIGGKVWDPELFTEKAQMTREAPVSLATLADQEIINMEVDLKVQSLSLVLNKKEYQLAKAGVTAFEAHVSTRDANFEVTGHLGSISLQDSSPGGSLYRERFMTTGDTAVDFHLFKYGTPDPDGLREYDVSIMMKMTSVWYIHTHRFLQEILAFAQNFSQFQDYLGRSRAASSGKKISMMASRNARIKMDIDAGAPVILIPHSSRTKDVLVLDLGKLKVHNKFLFDDDSQFQTPSEKGKPFSSNSETLYPVSSVFGQRSVPKNVASGVEKARQKSSEAFLLADPSSSVIIPGLFSLLSGSHVRYTTNLGKHVAEMTSSPIRPNAQTAGETKTSEDLKSDQDDEKCLLDVMEIELFDMEVYSAEWIDKLCCKNPKSDDLIFPSFIITRQQHKILKESCRLCLQVRRNLDVDLSHKVPDISINGKLSSVQLSVDTKQYQLVKGLLSHNFGEQLEELHVQLMSSLKDPKILPVLSGNPNIGVSVDLLLENVELSLLLAHEDLDLSCQEASLVKFDFVRSNLKVLTRSDGLKEIGLVSHEIKIHDTRYKDFPVNVRPNMFSEILRPSTNYSQLNSLQLELHCRLGRDCDRYTILLNNMRVIGIFDWLLAVKDFLALGPDDPFKHDKEVKEPEKSSSRSMFVVNNGSIVTKRISTAEERKPLMELCINMTNTELVIVEDCSDRDTNAVIIKGTALLSYREKGTRPLMCNLQNLEVFSCSLAAEEETALSIIDPMSLNLELNRTPDSNCGSAGLHDVACYEDRPPILEVSFQMLSIRLSYNDIKLFSAIINSMPQQLKARNVQPPRNASLAVLVSKLEDLGFSTEDCLQGLQKTDGQLENAALWLAENAEPVPKRTGMLFRTSGFEIKEGGVSICLIDDCLDADVPLAEIVFNDIYVFHRFLLPGQGKARFSLFGDYYNRSLSGWEPFLEKFSCDVEWNQGVVDEGDKLYIDVKACETLNINCTRTFIEQYSRTKAKWIDDFTTSKSKDNSLQYNSRKRIPFVPYALRNQTGCDLKFLAINSAPRSHLSGHGSSEKDKTEESAWKTVRNGSELTFIIDEREKFRHKVTHELKVHQLKLKVDGWKEVGPVTVDKVGVFFRKAALDIDSTSSLIKQMPSARIVFEVKLEGTARKVVTVRSSLVLNNQLEDPVELKMEKSESYYCKMTIPPFSSLPLPLEFMYSKLWVRPSGWSLDWSCDPVEWQAVTKPGESSSCFNICKLSGSEANAYRFCISVYKQHYPEDDDKKSADYSNEKSLMFAEPGHIITLVPPVQVQNLLPVDLGFSIKTNHPEPFTSTVKPGKKSYIVGINLNQNMELSITLENFSKCKELVIPPGTLDYKVRMCLYDASNFVLELQVHIKTRPGGSLKLNISAPYWLINKTGLPLLFKQDGGTLAAGQSPEHEIARSVVPLLFCFPDKGSSEYCTMRIGNSVHGPGTVPHWCHHFILERGVAFRQLHISQSARPDWVYNIGIESRQGRGPYCDTNIVTFTPRYQLENRSCYKLAFAQKHFVDRSSPTDANYLSALPNCLLPFHWPRVDLDTLLCVRIMDPNIPRCNWSGGFLIDTVDSFHINMRAENNRCIFLRVDIVLQGAMYIAVFTDAEQMPPPYRIDNFSEVNVQFYQSQVEILKTYIKPRTSLAYAWDQPTLPPLITLKVPSGTSANYDMRTDGDGEKLNYENFIYIAFTHTFKSHVTKQPPDALPGYKQFEESQKLVLDVVPPNRVVLKKKESGKRSQLWRMTSTGLLQHEGLSVPRDPSRSSLSSVTYVLDIMDIALQPNREVPLTVRKPDDRRRSTQVWNFIDGRLCCGNKNTNLVVQAKEGIFGLRDGGEAVLGHSTPESRLGNQEVPKEMAIHREKLQPGSGMLCVKVLNEGPTRVLQITDVTQQRYDGKNVQDWIVISEKVQKPTLAIANSRSSAEVETFSLIKTFEVSVNLPFGLGISVVDKTPQEIVYLSLQGVLIEYILSDQKQILKVDVKSLQMDNQLFGARKPVLMYMSNEHTDRAAGPALHICAHKTSSCNWNAEIYKQLLIDCKPFALHVEEKVLWKLMQFIGFNQSESELETFTECHIGSGRGLPVATLTDLRRYYFETIKISGFEVTLSMHTSRDLSPDLKAIKRSLHIPLIRFEDAQVELDPFVKSYLFETSAFLLENIKLHYTRELRSQAAKILGSVDFLGNPIGLFSDMAEGVSCLLEGNVPGLLKNVTKGVSNTAAKLTSTFSDTVEIATFDKKYQLARQQILDQHSEGGSEHLKAGFKGLMHGFVSAVTSIPFQTYTEIQEKGPMGLISGLSKGVIGSVTKPVAGLLDLTAGAAHALRDSSKGVSHKRPPKVRKPRCCYGHGGLLPPFSSYHADAQEFLFQQNQNNFDEMFIAKYQIQMGSDSLHVLISSQQLYFLRKERDVMLLVTYHDLFMCNCLREAGKSYIELTMKDDIDRGASSEVLKRRPRVRCDSEIIAQEVVQHIVYAKNLYDEIKQTLPPEDNIANEYDDYTP